MSAPIKEVVSKNSPGRISVVTASGHTRMSKESGLTMPSDSANPMASMFNRAFHSNNGKGPMQSASCETMVSKLGDNAQMQIAAEVREQQ
mmetsp:Transcript_18057/g.38555  ORF Transcript_18057/g.38555 Transcript_18057/m.38555 type:complete len:90 (+) Transcript_18057:93-362(+)